VTENLSDAWIDNRNVQPTSLCSRASVLLVALVILSRQLIDAEYQKLGHTLGWRFLTCPEANIDSASVALISIHPGGDVFEDGKWSVEAGNAYVLESWKGCSPGKEKLQKQVRRMFEVMEVSPNAILSGYLVPFRSPSWEDLPAKPESIQFGISLWREVFKRTRVDTVVAFGKETRRHMIEILDAHYHASHPACWGTQTIEDHRFGAAGRLLVLPNLSRFQLFGQSRSEAAFRAALG
jgi:hypothetical protein